MKIAQTTFVPQLTQTANTKAAAASVVEMKAKTQVKENSTISAPSVAEGVKAMNDQIVKTLGTHLNAKA